MNKKCLLSNRIKIRNFLFPNVYVKMILEYIFTLNSLGTDVLKNRKKPYLTYTYTFYLQTPPYNV